MTFPLTGRGDEYGCPGAGKDQRILPRLTCWLQRHLSFKSGTEPFSILICFPPFIAINIPIGKGRYAMVRAGFRFDRNWKGFLFPESAAKISDHVIFYLWLVSLHAYLV